ncbi:MAG: NAD(P)/FAD-dependent oxidoreductase [Lachnospiraceae bacterium]|nr:NAD(P)/FAD-dependent oxidoreductase [Lachnospiraceae bacterium]
MKTIIIGGGPAGMMAAIAAAQSGSQVELYEKNEKLGKKLFISGKGRCNMTNASDMKTVMENVVSNPRFMFGAFGKFTNDDLVRLIEEAGCPTKVERGNRVFPVSDHSSDVIKALVYRLKSLGVRIHLNEEVKGLLIKDGVCRGIKLPDSRSDFADKIIIATGACSYPGTGSTGDGYRWAVYAGHKIIDTVPALVPLTTKENVSAMMGLSLKNVRATIYDEGKELYSEFGEMLFTHFGVSGPVILSASSYITGKLHDRDRTGKNLKLSIDLKPALDEETLDARVLKDFEKNKNKALKNSLGELLPSGLIDEAVAQSGISPYKKVNEITRHERANLIKALKNLTFTITGTRGWNEAIITQGGVSTKEINPRTMESKLVNNLYFAGEILDVDALTGGYNLQIAWSTGWSAGSEE